VTIDNINGLLSLYQKAIEYFSAQDSARYEDFLNRNRNLLQREDVQMVLNSMEDSEKGTNEGKKSHQHRYFALITNSIDPPFEISGENKLKKQKPFRISSEGSDSNGSLPELQFKYDDDHK
jgi:hypothetical protein